MFHDIIVAFAFLTRLPIRHRDEISLPRTAQWFPLVGAAVGLLGGGTYLAAASLLPHAPAAVLALIVTTLITGGFHQDGLADIMDGLVGGWTREDRLRILKDSRHGTYGVLAIVLQSLLQVTTLASFDGRQGLLALVCAHTLGRLVPVILMATPAAPGQAGMGTAYAREIRWHHLVVAASLAGLITAPLLGARLLLVLLALLVVDLVFVLWVRRRIGGVVGDALGAAEQISESTVLVLCLAIIGSAHA